MNDILEELESLLFDWEAGSLDEAGVARVREILRRSEEARSYYLKQQAISMALHLDRDAGLDSILIAEPSADAELEGISADGPTNPTKPVRSPGDSAHVFRISYWAAAAAALLFCVLASRVLYLEFSSGPANTANALSTSPPADPPQEATSSGVAQLTRLVEVQWAARQQPLEIGDSLQPGRLAIQAGYAQVEFFCGATVVIEGPAELDLKTATLARVHSGRLRAHVPPAARGFSLEVDDMKVVDLGTEFGLNVSPDGADLQVFDGEVELQPAEAEKRLLTTGEAIQRNEQGEIESTAITPERFLDINALEARAGGQRTARYEAWKSWSDQARRDRRLIAYYAFDQEGGWQRTLPSSLEPANEELNGAVVGARRVAGRWPEKTGLEFKRPGDRVRVQIPGEYGSLTFACWVKIDSLDRWYNSLFLTDNYNQGEPHWQILNTGQLFFSVRRRPDDKSQVVDPHGPAHQKVLSPPFWKPSLSGRWLHLATTYDVDAGRTRHYLNGQVIHEESIAEELLVETTRIGAASIGNWSIPTRPDAEFAIRNLNGSLDEFAIYSAALAPDEIKEMYQHGKP